MPSPAELKILQLEARRREIEEIRKTEVLNVDGLPEDPAERLEEVSRRLLEALPNDRAAFQLEMKRREALLAALHSEWIALGQQIRMLQLTEQDRISSEARAERDAIRSKELNRQHAIHWNQRGRWQSAVFEGVFYPVWVGWMLTLVIVLPTQIVAAVFCRHRTQECEAAIVRPVAATLWGLVGVCAAAGVSLRLIHAATDEREVEE